MVSNGGIWNFVKRCWEGGSRKHPRIPRLCFQVKCPAKEKCGAIMNLSNLWKHMQKVHHGQQDILRCPACGVDISCLALDAHMMNNHNHCKANTQLLSASVPSPLVPIRSGNAAAHPPYIEMIKDSIVEIGNKKGSSRPAITKHLIAKYPDMDGQKSRSYLRAAFRCGLKSEALVFRGLYLCRKPPIQLIEFLAILIISCPAFICFFLPHLSIFTNTIGFLYVCEFLVEKLKIV